MLDAMINPKIKLNVADRLFFNAMLVTAADATIPNTTPIPIKTNEIKTSGAKVVTAAT